MKKGKIFLSTMAAAVFATSAGALVACGDGIELPEGATNKTYTITFDANGGTLKGDNNKITIASNGKITGTIPTVEEREDYTFKYWSLSKTGAEVEIKFSSFKDSTTVYAVWGEKTQEEDPNGGGGDDEDPNGGGGDEETTGVYTITFSGGDYGTVSATSATTANGRLTKDQFPLVEANEGWRHVGWLDEDGYSVDEEYDFDHDITVTADYAEDEVDPDALDIRVIVNGTSVGKLDKYDHSTATDGRDQDYGRKGFTLNKDDEVSFTVEGADIDFWVDGYSETADNFVSYETGKMIYTVTIKADGTYDFYLKHYPIKDEWVLDVQGESDEPIVIPNPETLDIQVLVNGESKVSLDSYDKWLEDQTDGRLHDYGKQKIDLNKDDVITFTVDGVAIDFWPDGYSETIAGLVSYTPGVKNTSVTVKANGTYDIYLKEYDSGWSLDVQGKAEGGDTPIIDDNEELDIQVLVNGESKVSLDSYDKWLEEQTDGRLHDYGKQKIALNKDDVITFTVDGVAIEFWPDGYSATIGKLVSYTAGVKNTSVTVKANGTYDIYLKEYDSGWSLDVQGKAEGGDTPIVGGDEEVGTVVTIDTTAENKGYMVGGSIESGKGVFMEFEAGDYGDQYVLTNYHLDKDDVIKFQNGTGSLERATISGGTAAACFESTTGGIKVLKSGTYTFYVKTDENEIYVNGTPDFEQVEGDTISITVECKDGTITFVIETDGTKTNYLHAWVKSSGTNLTGADWPGKAVSDGDTVKLTSYNMTEIGLIINYGEGNAQTDDIKLTTGGNKTITVAKDGSCKVE